MKTVNIYEAKTRLSQLIAEVEAVGERIVLCRNGKPVADLVRHQEQDFYPAAHPDLIGARYSGDPCAGLPIEDWPEELR